MGVEMNKKVIFIMIFCMYSLIFSMNKEENVRKQRELYQSLIEAIKNNDEKEISYLRIKMNKLKQSSLTSNKNAQKNPLAKL